MSDTGGMMWGRVLQVHDGSDFTPLCETSFNAVEQAIEVARMLPAEHPTRLDLLQSCAEALKFRMMFAGYSSAPSDSSPTDHSTSSSS